MTPSSLDLNAEHLLRQLVPQVLGALTRRCGDFESAEDAMQEALLAAVSQWPSQGIPENPAGWLYQVASRRLVDLIRSDSARRLREQRFSEDLPQSWSQVEGFLDTETDDSLVLLLMCCHPALTEGSAIALTLRAVGGLSTAEIAQAFLVPEATMAQRISRAKRAIKTSGAAFELPPSGERAARLRRVQHVLYLMFSEGYVSSAGPRLQRIELATEAIRLTRALRCQLPNEAEVLGLLALLLLTDARRDARSGPLGELIPLDEQDRGRWDRRQIAEGVALLTTALSKGAIGPYQLQAAIAALHDEAARLEDTDWPQILALYTLLAGMSDNPMVVLNRAVALAMVEGPGAALAELETLARDPRIAQHHRLAAVRAHLLERAGAVEGAITSYREAARRTASQPERDYLLARAARLTVNPDLAS